MARSMVWRINRWAPVMAAAVCLWAAAPASAQFFFPFVGQPERPRPAPPQQLTPGQVRAVLAREGARMVGAPRLRGADIVAIGRDEMGDRKRFTLDAMTGEILDITVIARHEERPPPAPGDSLTPPGGPIPPPEHAPHGQEAVDSPSPEAKPAAPSSGSGASAAPPAPKADPADSVLSPIKPLKPAGAPKVEPLPK